MVVRELYLDFINYATSNIDLCTYYMSHLFGLLSAMQSLIGSSIALNLPFDLADINV